MKQTYYFPHDYHARHDPKLAALISKFGYVGYGWWWSFIELLHEQGGKIEKFPQMYAGLAHELKQNEAELKQLISASINDFCLLKEDATHLWSDRVIGNMEELLRKRTQKAVAGRLGGIISGQKRSKTKQNEAPLEANEQKESKVKESKVNKDIQDFFSYYLLKTKKKFMLSDARVKLIKSRLKDYSLEDMKKAVDNFVKDTWEGRKDHMDLVYCIGIRNKVDNLEKWLFKKDEKPQWNPL